MQTIKNLRHAINTYPEIYIQPRFGVSERWIKISKKIAMNYIEDYDDNDTAKDFEMNEFYSLVNQTHSKLNKTITAVYIG